MSDILDLERLLAPISDEHPCGEELEDFVFSPNFGELERLAAGRQEQVMGDEVIPAEEPDWRAVQEKALALFDEVKSLRVAVFLTKAITAREGLAGMAAGLELIRAMLERYWDQVDPLIDDGDATERMHTLGELGSQEGFIQLVRKVLLVSSQAIGKFSIRDYLVATERLAVPAGDTVTDASSINQALMDTPLENLQQTLAMLDASMEHARAIESTFNSKVGAADQMSYDDLIRLGRDVRPGLQEALERRGIAAGDGAAAEGEAAEVGAAPQQAAMVPGEIRTREDVVKMLDRITEYFNKHEPSSPVPLLMQRAKRLVSQDFMSIMKDLAPDGLKQLELVSGSLKED
ncbi:MAG: type VI secretion system protein TssA [Wenzhouxiangella sp.]|jgi:type VI secretion system protein ImpA|nr:type VI secretion system protein TssA [Wenzhouxiangella sp.]